MGFFLSYREDRHTTQFNVWLCRPIRFCIRSIMVSVRYSDTRQTSLISVRRTYSESMAANLAFFALRVYACTTHSFSACCWSRVPSFT